MKGWDIYNNLKSTGDILYTLILGFILILVTFIIYYIRRKKEKLELKNFMISKSTNKLTINGFICMFGIIIILIGCNSTYTNSSITKKITSILGNKKLEDLTSVSGVVEVLSQDDAGIRLDKEIIKINNKIFRIPAGLSTLFYNTTIEKGGLLTKDKNVTIYYIEANKNNENDVYFFEDGKICKIKIN